MARESSSAPAQNTSPADAALLRAIRDSASDIANVRDGLLVLRAIVRHTRRLLGTDMAYLSLNDLAAGETYIHVTDGVETEEYRTIRMPLGTGVLGAVAAGGAAVRTSDYLSDSTMNHLSDIDEIVRREGVRAIMGAPLRVSGRVIGGLLVADRTATHFSRGAAEALEQMAQQAAIATEQSHLVAECARLTADLKNSEGRGEERLLRAERILQLDERMMAGLLSPSGLTGILESLSEALHLEVGVHDSRGRLIGGHHLLPPAAFEQWEAKAAIATSLQTGRAVGMRGERRPYVAMAVTSGDEHMATLVTRGPFETTEAQMLERAAVFVSTIMLFERSLTDAYNRAQSALFDDLISDRPGDRHALNSAAQQYGIPAREPSLVLTISTNSAERYQAMRATRTALHGRLAVVSLHGTDVCVILGDAADAQLGQTLPDELVTALEAQGIAPLIGVAQAESIEGIRTAHDRAHHVLAAEVALGWTRGHADAARLGLAGLLLSGSDRPAVDAMIDQILGPLATYDEAHGTALRLTAWTYFECGTHLESTAARLFVHRNTVRQRAERIDTLLGAGWRTPPRSADVHFALRVWRLREGGLLSTPQ